MAARLFVEPARLQEGVLALTGADFRYLAKVLRLRSGDEVTLFDGEGREARGRVARVDGERGVLELEVEAPGDAGAAAALEVTLLCALLKADKMDLVVQKACELGAARLVPVAAARSVVRLDAARSASRLHRWRKIAREAARQCGRADEMTVEPIVPLADAVRAASASAWRAVLYEAERGVTLRSALPATRPAALVLAVGPEGGFEAQEIEVAAATGFQVVGFGPRILRAETAALAALAVVGYALGDLG